MGWFLVSVFAFFNLTLPYRICRGRMIVVRLEKSLPSSREPDEKVHHKTHHFCALLYGLCICRKNACHHVSSWVPFILWMTNTKSTSRSSSALLHPCWKDSRRLMTTCFVCHCHSWCALRHRCRHSHTDHSFLWHGRFFSVALCVCQNLFVFSVTFSRQWLVNIAGGS